MSLVSVIIPTFNRSTYLEEAIRSVEEQTYQNIEILVIDDGSTKPYAIDICKNYKKCTYYFKKNGGLSSARNFGVQKAKGKYIAFLDDDDFWDPKKLEKQIEILENDLTIDCVHSAASVVDDASNVTGKIIGANPKKAYKRSGYVFWNALGVWVVKSPTPLLRKKIFHNGLWFDESIKVGEDIDFYQRMFYRHKVKYIDEPLAFYREYQNSNRLSEQKIRYVGIEKRMLENFNEMRVTNSIVRHFISIKLLKMGVVNWNIAFPDKPLKLNNILMCLRPKKYIDLIDKFKNEQNL